jgi:threonine dehydrogenase-like Zn-dependent dehydrogenase
VRPSAGALVLGHDPDGRDQNHADDVGGDVPLQIAYALDVSTGLQAQGGLIGFLAHPPSLPREARRSQPENPTVRVPASRYVGSLAALAKNGSVVTVGAHGGEVVPVDVILLFRHQWSLVGSVRATADEIRRCIEMVAGGELHPVIHTALPHSEAREAHRVLEAREQFGKVLLVP